jgi:ferritin-like metal-binding protein YciE
MKALRTLFLNELADMHDAENRIVKALPTIIKAATCHQLQEALQDHLDETKGHVQKVQRVFAAFEEKPQSKKCQAIAGILEEGSDIIKENEDSCAINAAIIAACQKVEHYEIASYGTLRTWAKLLGNEEAEEILGEILDEEKQADHTLNDLSAKKNEEALQEVEAGAAT